LHPGRPGMFGVDGKPLIPGIWAQEFLQLAFPGVKITHVDELAKDAPLIFHTLHINLVNWASWVLPSEDLYPPRISRRFIGPHPLLTLMPQAVKRALDIDEAEGDRAVLIVRRSPPAGRRLVNERELVEELRQLYGLTVRVADLSLMLFAAQVEAVAHASILVGAHGQGLFNLIFLPAGGGVVEVPPCGLALALVYNVAEHFGLSFTEILDSSCDEEFMAKFQANQCQPCAAREILSSGRAPTDLDSANVGDCERLPPACDVRAAQTVAFNNVSRAASIIQEAHAEAEARRAALVAGS